MRLTAIAVALFALAGCHKSGNPGPSTQTTGMTPEETAGVENSAGSYPTGPTSVPGNSGVGATGVTDPIDQPPAPDTPTK